MLALSFGPTARASPGPLNGRAMWIWYLNRSDHGDLAAIAARAHAAGVTTLIVKSGDGPVYWSQFSRRLVRSLRSAGLRVCAWQYVYGNQPITEAAIGARAVRAGAECLVIDAEAEYEGRYASAQSYLHQLRARIGRGFPLGLSSFPYVDYHPAFPYSVFLGPGGAQFDLPQMYWRDIGASIASVFHHTFTENRIYRRAILPVGQSYQAPGPLEIGQFRGLTVHYRARGVSWWDYAWASVAGLWPALSGPFTPPPLPAPLREPHLGQGSQGDQVLWMQEHLARAMPAQRTTGVFGTETLANLSAFQLRHRLPVSGRTDAATWRALLRLPAVRVNWTLGGAHTARGGDATRSVRAPASAGLRAIAYEIPELGSTRSGGAEAPVTLSP